MCRDSGGCLREPRRTRSIQNISSITFWCAHTHTHIVNSGAQQTVAGPSIKTGRCIFKRKLHKHKQFFCLHKTRRVCKCARFFCRYHSSLSIDKYRFDRDVNFALKHGFISSQQNKHIDTDNLHRMSSCAAIH